MLRRYVHFLRVARSALLLSLSAGGLGSAQVKTTIELWSFLDPAGSNVRAKAFAHVIKTFEERNPDVRIRTTIVQWDQISAQLMRSDKAGAVPDVAMLYAPNVPANLQAGNLLPLDSYLARWSKSERDDLIMLNADRWNSQTYGVPWNLLVLGMVYNAKALRELNLEVPGDLASLATSAARVNQAGWIGLAFGFNPSDPVGSIEWFIPTLAGMGANILNPNGTAAFDSPQARKLVQYVYDLIHKYHAVSLSVALTGDEAISQLGESGRVVFIRTGSFRVAFMREKTGLGNDLQFMPFPGFTRNKRSPALLQGWNAVIPARAKHPDEAWRFIEHWISPEMQIHQARTAGYLPVRHSVATSDVFDAPDRTYLKDALEWSGDKPVNFNWPAHSDYMFNVLARMFERIITDDISIPDGLQWAEREYNKRASD